MKQRRFVAAYTRQSPSWDQSFSQIGASNPPGRKLWACPNAEEAIKFGVIAMPYLARTRCRRKRLFAKNRKTAKVACRCLLTARTSEDCKASRTSSVTMETALMSGHLRGNGGEVSATRTTHTAVASAQPSSCGAPSPRLMYAVWHNRNRPIWRRRPSARRRTTRRQKAPARTTSLRASVRSPNTMSL